MDKVRGGRPDPTGDYCRAVIGGDIVAGKLVRLACERHLRDLSRAPFNGFYFDYDAAQAAIDFFPAMLSHYKGEYAGEPFVLSAWQMFIVGSIFGWKRTADARRRFQSAYVQVARKNGKSALAAGIGLLMFVLDGEAAPEIYTAATTLKQAKIVFKDAREFVLHSDELSDVVRVWNHLLTDEAGGEFTALAADAHTLDGLNPHCAIIDELHRHPTSQVVDVLDTATGARAQPLLFMITTAGDNVFGVCYDEYDYAVQVLQRAVNDNERFAFIAEIDDGDDWQDPECWIKANPNLGVSITRKYLENKLIAAQYQPKKQKEFKRLRLNLWTETVGDWLDMDAWNACDSMPAADELIGAECYCGVDLAKTRDITASVLLFPPTDERKLWVVKPKFYVPEAKVDAARRGDLEDRVPYNIWDNEGLITTTPGNVVDYQFIERDLLNAREVFDLKELGFDPWNATQFAQQLDAEGIVTVEVRQGYRTMNRPTQRLAELVADELLAHGGNPVLRWMASNLTVDTDHTEAVKPNKHKSRNRIDGIVALICAIQRAVSASDDGPSVYETRGVIAA